MNESKVSCCQHHLPSNLAYGVNDAAKLCGVEPRLLRAQIWHDLLAAKYPTSRPVIEYAELCRWYAAYIHVIKPYIESAEEDGHVTAIDEASHIFFLVSSWSMNQQEKPCCNCHSIQKLAYTFEEAGEAIGVSAATIRKLVRDSYLIAKYPTSRPVILVEDLRSYIESCPDEPRNR